MNYSSDELAKEIEALSMIPKPIQRTVELFSRHIAFNRRLPKRFGGLWLRVSSGASLKFYKSLSAGHWKDLYDFAEDYVLAGAVAELISSRKETRVFTTCG